LLPDGKLFTVMRNMTGFIYYSVSSDNGKTWKTPQMLKYSDNGQGIPHPMSPCPLYKLSNGKFLLIYHNNNGKRLGYNQADKVWDGVNVGGVVRNPTYYTLGEFKPDAEQPIWFGDPVEILNTQDIPIPPKMSPEIGTYPSITEFKGRTIFWYPDRKRFLLGKYLDEVQTSGKFSLPPWVLDNMIFPSGINWKLQGSCSPLQKVSLSFGGIKISTKAGKAGIWKMDFPPVKPGISGEMVFVCNGEKKIIKDVLSGNIWLCAGQSNMVVPVSYSAESAEAGNDISSSDIRYFNGNQWLKVTRENVQSISAVALFFAAEMEKRQKSPVGIFVAARGGTGIEAWIPEDAFPDNETGRRFKILANDSLVLKAAGEDKADVKPYGQHKLAKWGLTRAVPASLFDELVRPSGQMPVAGVVWYQGESNAENIDQAAGYHLWLENLISSYRKLFDNPGLPFAIIQIPAYDAATPESRKAWTAIQNAQETAVNNTKQAVLVDIKDLGDLNDIHPRRKKEVGIRTAKAVCELINNSKADLDIVYIGNSVTYGATLDNPAQDAPPVIASNLLEQKKDIHSVSFSNQGRSGFTTVNYLPGGDTFSEVVNATRKLHANPSHTLIFSILLGANDSAVAGTLGAPVSKEDYIRNLKSIVDKLLRLFPDSKVILQQPIWYSPNFQNTATYLAEGLARLESYIPEIELLVKQFKKEGAPVYMGDKKGFAYFKKKHLTDMKPENGRQGIFYSHPNKKGAAMLASFWADVIYKALQ
jgi:lysophospholipase L1-like esterase